MLEIKQCTASSHLPSPQGAASDSSSSSLGFGIYKARMHLRLTFCSQLDTSLSRTRFLNKASCPLDRSHQCVRAYCMILKVLCVAIPVALTDDVWQVCGVSPLGGTHWGWKMPLSFFILQRIFLLAGFASPSTSWPPTIAMGLCRSIDSLTLKLDKTSSPCYGCMHCDEVTFGGIIHHFGYCR